MRACQRARGAAQQRANGTASLLHLPEGIAAVFDFAERIERADTGQRDEFLAVEFRYSLHQVIDRYKDSTKVPRGENRICWRLPESLGVVEADAQRERPIRFRLQRAEPFGTLHVHGANAQAVALCVFYEYSGRVEAHRLIVEQPASESRKVVNLEICRGISDQCEAGGV